MPHEFLQTERLLMRPLTASDEADVASIVGDAETAARDVREAVEHWRSHGFGPFAAVERASGGFVGVIELHFAGDGLIGIEPDEVEIGWVIDSTRRGEGLASEGAATVLAFGLDLADHVVAYIGHCNDPSIRVAEKIGMRHERDGRARDGDAVRIYVAGRRDVAPSSGFPRSSL
jgi:RimJ/RimL family protein N-acetyltransferase